MILIEGPCGWELSIFGTRILDDWHEDIAEGNHAKWAAEESGKNHDFRLPALEGCLTVNAGFMYKILERQHELASSCGSRVPSSMSWASHWTGIANSALWHEVCFEK
jgi:hypothetical protein